MRQPHDIQTIPPEDAADRVFGIDLVAIGLLLTLVLLWADRAIRAAVEVVAVSIIGVLTAIGFTVLAAYFVAHLCGWGMVFPFAPHSPPSP
jgi:hypothetical protein